MHLLQQDGVIDLRDFVYVLVNCGSIVRKLLTRIDLLEPRKRRVGNDIGTYQTMFL